MKPVHQFALGTLLLMALVPVIGHATPNTASMPSTDTRVVKPIVEVFVTEDSDFLEVAGVVHAFRDQKDGFFTLYFVSESQAPIKVRGGLTIIPDYTVANAPRPDILVIGTQGQAVKPSSDELNWLHALHAENRTLISVCDGADWLDAAGLLPPAVKLTKETPYIQIDGETFAAAELHSGMALALNFIDTRYGRARAVETLKRMGWDESVLVGIPAFK